MYLNMLHSSNQQLELLNLKTTEVLKEQLQQAITKKDTAVVHVQLAEHQAAQNKVWYEAQLAAANLAYDQAVAANNRISQEKEQLQQRLADLAMENFCLQFKNLKILMFFLLSPSIFLLIQNTSFRDKTTKNETHDPL